MSRCNVVSFIIFSKAQFFLKRFNSRLLYNFHSTQVVKIEYFCITFLCCSFTYVRLLPNFCSHRMVISVTFGRSEIPYIKRILSVHECHLLPLKMELIWFWILLSGDVHLCSSVHRNWNIVLLTDIGAWKMLLLWQRLSFLLACWVSFEIVSLTVPSKNIQYKCTWFAFPVFQDAICLIVWLWVFPLFV